MSCLFCKWSIGFLGHVTWQVLDHVTIPTCRIFWEGARWVELRNNLLVSHWVVNICSEILDICHHPLIRMQNYLIRANKTQDQCTAKWFCFVILTFYWSRDSDLTCNLVLWLCCCFDPSNQRDTQPDSHSSCHWMN